jgi:hypothetical protein
MKKVGVLIAFAVLITASSAYGRNFWRGDADRGGVGNYYLDTNWQDTFVPGVNPNEGRGVEIRYDGTATVVDDGTGTYVALIETSDWRLGYLWDGSEFSGTGHGHAEILASDVIIAAPRMIIGEYTSRTDPASSITQSGGEVEVDHVWLGRTAEGPDGSGWDGHPDWMRHSGHGLYTISGGTLDATYGTTTDGIEVGDYVPELGVGAGGGPSYGLGIFRVEGDAATILTRAYYQNQDSRTEAVLSATGGISLIDVQGTEDQMNTLAGTLLVDSSAATPTDGDIVKILEVTGAPSPGDWLDYTALTIDPASSEGWSIDTSGLANVLQVKYTASAGLDGDFDGDGDVDGADLLVWQRDTSVGLLSDWQTNFGDTTPPAVAAVPEPFSIGLLSLGLLALIGVRRR